jgi:uncharacterized protein with NRDE domain
MCVIYIAHRQHPSYPLILLANRDEFYDRPTAPAARWEDAPQIMAGRDLVAGGTWLGATDRGRFAAVTNYRDQRAPKGERSRGILVADFLRAETSARAFLKSVKAEAELYSGFNLIVGEISNVRDELFYFSNRSEGIRNITPGIYGLSNHLLNTPWPKVSRGLQQFGKLIENEDISFESCFELLADETIATEELLPDTGVGVEIEKVLSPIFIRTPNYGTRSSTVFSIGRDYKVELRERVFV